MTASLIDHGRRGRVKVVSEMNTDRQPPSRQVWVELYHKGNKVGTSSANLVLDMGQVDPDRMPDDLEDTRLTSSEMAFVNGIAEEFEGAVN